MAKLPFAGVMATLLLAGCVVGPNYKGPPTVLTPAQPFYRASEAPTTPGTPENEWWRALQDPELDRLIDAALASNPDIEASAARLRESRAGLQEAHADLMPTTGLSALYLHANTGGSPLTGGSGGRSNFDLYTGGFNASWEVDLFGGQHRAVENAAAGAEARMADLQAASLSLTAEVAQAYVSLRDLQNRIALAQSSADLQQRMLSLTQLRLSGGTASVLDVARLTTEVETTRTALIPLRAQIEMQIDRLALLTARAPGPWTDELAAVTPLPLPPATVQVDDPAAMLRRRPDIRAAERRIKAANAVIGQHVADYFPKLKLIGGIGLGSTDLSQLATTSALGALAAPSLQWEPFEFGRTSAAIAQARAGRDEAEANYRQTVLSALEEAETALSRYGLQRQDVAGLARVKASADKAADLTRLRYAGGTATLTDTLDTERQRLDAEQSLAAATADLTQDFIALEKSLGLGLS